jgi:hypothetical protein
MQKLILTTHGRQRMSERGITFRHLRTAFAGPHEIGSARQGCQKLVSLVRGRTLVVIYEETGSDTCLIVTAYWRE